MKFDWQNYNFNYFGTEGVPSNNQQVSLKPMFAIIHYINIISMAATILQ
jgi:hypothetical protein